MEIFSNVIGTEYKTCTTAERLPRLTCKTLLKRMSLRRFASVLLFALVAATAYAQPRYTVAPRQWGGGEGATDIYRLSADFDGDGNRDYALGAFCGVHAECSFTLFLAQPPTFTADGEMFVSYDSVQVCP